MIRLLAPFEPHVLVCDPYLSVAEGNSGQNRDDATKADLLPLHLEVREPEVIKYLLALDESERVAKANEALHVGVFVIQSAHPTLDLRGLP